MVKKREAFHNNFDKSPTAEEIEAFASRADGADTPSQKSEVHSFEPNANRDFKSIRVPFNQYEFSKLEQLSQKTGRSKLNAIRWAILQACEQS